MKRRGLGKGLGKGYKNIAPIDSHIHSLSAKGVKSYQKSLYAKEGGLSAFKERLDILNEEAEVDAENLLAIEEHTGSKVEEIEKYPIDYIGESDGWFLIKMDDGSEWVLAPSDDDAEKIAVEQVKEQLYDEPELFNQDWLSNHAYMSDVDKRITAGDEADARVDGMEEDEIRETAELDGEYDDLEEEKDDLEDEQSDLDLSTEKGQKRDTEIDDEISLIEDRMSEIDDEAVDEAIDKITDEIAKQLDDDPIGYFEELGYEKSKIIKDFMQFNYEEASQDAVDTDGWQHFLARYDNNSEDLPNGMVLFRVN